MKMLRDYAKTTGQTITETEGGSHTKVTVGDKQSTVPRHSEINEITARAILKQMGVKP